MLCMLFGVPIPQALPEPIIIVYCVLTTYKPENLWTLRGFLQGWVPLRVQVSNNHILTPNLYHNYYYPKTKYLIIGYLDPKP